MHPTAPARLSRVDFSKNGHQPPRKSRLRRLYVMLRKLVRSRQESVAVHRVVQLMNTQRGEFDRTLAEVRVDAIRDAVSLKAKIADRDETISNLKDQLERQKADYAEMIRSRDKKITDYDQLQIPMLKNELEVQKEYSKHLAALVKKQLLHEEAEVAVENLRISAVDAQAESASTGMTLRERPI